MAARILGMGDIVSLVEEAHAKIDLEKRKRVAERSRRAAASTSRTSSSRSRR